ELGDGPAKVMLLEEAVRLADSHRDVARGFAARQSLIRAATFGGYPEKSLVAFSWSLAQSDRNPLQFPPTELLWQDKWIVGSLNGFPQISRQQIADMLEDLAQRFRRVGAGPHAVHKLRFDLSMDLGDRDEARRSYRKWKRSRRDWLSDCVACDLDASL